MKLAVFSDIHGNFDAFERVLADIETQQVDRLVCLGDCVGYGPEPERVLAEIRHRGIETILGNHEAAVLDTGQLSWFNPIAAKSLRKTRKMISTVSLDQIRDLPRALIIEGARFTHGFPPDSERIYLFRKSDREIRETLNAMQEPICFVGHTHDLKIIGFEGRKVVRHGLEQGIRKLAPDQPFIVNIGSVGQPRDGNNNAKYIVWEPAAHTIDVRFVPYDIAKVVEKINLAGLPEVHGRRLW
jgi:predicted phosphodiesterase